MKEIKEVKLTSIYDVFSSEEIEKIKKYTLPCLEAHQCHANAARFAIDGLDGYSIDFVEGYFNEPIDIFGHCFNKVTKDENGEEYYIDLTTELVNGEDPTKLKVFVYDEWDWVLIEDLFDEYGQSFIPHLGFFNEEGKKIKVKRIGFEYERV